MVDLDYPWLILGYWIMQNTKDSIHSTKIASSAAVNIAAGTIVASMENLPIDLYSKVVLGIQMLLKRHLWMFLLQQLPAHQIATVSNNFSLAA